MAKQWHPKFADLLRPLLEQYFEVQTNVPVGDVPREADLVLLRKKKAARPPFRGLWRHLHTWNVIEYKGPSVSARIDDVDLLVELGLGIHRRLNSERAKLGLDLVPASEVSFWYLANRLSRKFRTKVERLLGPLQSSGEGVWQCQLLGRSMFFVSDSEMPIDSDSLPLHLLSRESVADEVAMGRLVLADPSLVDLYGALLVEFHREVLEELHIMARTARKGRKWDLEKILNFVGMQDMIRQIGADRMIAEVGLDKLIDQVGLDKLIEQVGLHELINKAGAERVIEELSKDKAALEVMKRRLAREDH